MSDWAGAYLQIAWAIVVVVCEFPSHHSNRVFRQLSQTCSIPHGNRDVCGRDGRPIYHRRSIDRGHLCRRNGHIVHCCIRRNWCRGRCFGGRLWACCRHSCDVRLNRVFDFFHRRYVDFNDCINCDRNREQHEYLDEMGVHRVRWSKHLLQVNAKCREVLANNHEFDGNFTRRNGRQLISEKRKFPLNPCLSNRLVSNERSLPFNARIDQIAFAHSVSASIEFHFQRVGVRVRRDFPSGYVDGMKTGLRWNERHAKSAITISKTISTTERVLHNFSIDLPNWPALVESVHRVYFQMNFRPTLNAATGQVYVDRMSECTMFVLEFIATSCRLSFNESLYVLPVSAWNIQGDNNNRFNGIDGARRTHHIGRSIYRILLALRNHLHLIFDQLCVVRPSNKINFSFSTIFKRGK